MTLLTRFRLWRLRRARLDVRIAAESSRDTALQTFASAYANSYYADQLVECRASLATLRARLCQIEDEIETLVEGDSK